MKNYLTPTERVLAVIAGMSLLLLIVFVGIVITDDTTRTDKYRAFKKIEAEHPEQMGQVEILNGNKKLIYYGVAEIVNDGSNGERIQVKLDGMLESNEDAE